ncbi:GUN4 domain-containing protein [Kovacikia minuta CCNUW1]|uniref:GUN4 domain-containing protein n=1 Tax=Kovacikia minuta TaxID=2931930 RepID=UPI001CCB7A93|nr:GUN4 domain-containing protein [Kovacikia minuta]UBF27584.1 GUN4 domain-containing protein [Kovacikia minuta CCNUW1]
MHHLFTSIYKQSLKGKGEINSNKQDKGDLHLVIQHQQEDDLSSERFGANYYAKLRDLLAAQDWKAADQETAKRMLEVMDQQDRVVSILDSGNVEKFPCLDLLNIDKLWVKYSFGKFGFSIQKEIWESYGSPTSTNKDWTNFCCAIGWHTRGGFLGGKWLSCSQLTFDLVKAPMGHLPRVFDSWGWGYGTLNWKWVYLSSLGPRLTICNRQVIRP